MSQPDNEIDEEDVNGDTLVLMARKTLMIPTQWTGQHALSKETTAWPPATIPTFLSRPGDVRRAGHKSRDKAQEQDRYKTHTPAVGARAPESDETEGLAHGVHFPRPHAVRRLQARGRAPRVLRYDNPPWFLPRLKNEGDI